MSHRNASAYVWVGDAIYADDFHPKESIWGGRRSREATPAVLKQLFDQLLDQPGYRTFTRRGTNDGDSQPSQEEQQQQEQQTSPLPVLGVFDDHDYGLNNGDKYYQYRNESARLFMQFLEKSSASAAAFPVMEQRAAEGKGVYGVKVFDFSQPAGRELLSDKEAAIEPSLWGETAPAQLSDRSVAVFLLDCRSKKTPWKTGFPDKFMLDYEADFLGEEQWKWLKDSLERSTASVNLIVQGLQVHADRYFDGNKVEDWSRFPMAQHRLYQTILKSGVSAPVLVSGDVHMAELMRKDCRPADESSPTRALVEVTTSGMTHSWGTRTCARPHLSILCRWRLFQKALTTGMHWAHINGAWTDLVDLRGPPREGAKRRVQYALQNNFAEFEFDWDSRELIIRILGEKVGGKPLLSTAWSFDGLSGVTKFPETGKVKPSDFQSIYKHLSVHGAQKEDWICVNYRGPSSLAHKLYGFFTPVMLAGSIVMMPLIVPLLLAYFVLLRPRKKKKIKSS